MMREMVLPDVECAIVNLIQSSLDGKMKGLTLKQIGRDSTIQTMSDLEYLPFCLDDLVDKRIVEPQGRSRFKVTDQFAKSQVLLIPSSLCPTKKSSNKKVQKEESVPMEVDSGNKKALLSLEEHIRLFGANHHIEFFEPAK